MTNAAQLHARAEATTGTVAGLRVEPAPLGRAGRASFVPRATRVGPPVTLLCPHWKIHSED